MDHKEAVNHSQLIHLIGSLYDKFVADVSAKVESKLMDSILDRLTTSGMLTTEINTRIQDHIDGLTGLDKAAITEIVRGEIEDLDIEEKINDWMSNSFDIEDHIDVGDKIDDYLSDRLANMVKDEVRDLSFSVSVDY